MQIADTDILNTFKQNVNKGGSLLFRRYYRPLILFSNSLLNDDTFSEDIVQDVFYHFINTHAYTRVTPDMVAGRYDAVIAAVGAQPVVPRTR